MRIGAALGMAAALAAACAMAPPRMQERAEALARPEPDPAAHGTVQGLRDMTDLEKVTVQASVPRGAGPELVQILTPDLTPAAASEVRRAFEDCRWKPAVGPDGQRIEGSLTFAIQR